MRQLARVLVLAFALPLIVTVAAPAQAADGDTLASFTADLPACGLSVGIAFDGRDLMTTCYNSNVITVVSARDGARLRQFPVDGVVGIGAMAWDKGRDAIWACVTTLPVTSDAPRSFGWNSEELAIISFHPDGSAYASVVFTPVEGCFDGVAYDGTTDSLYLSKDVGNTIYHYAVWGEVLGTQYVGSLNCFGNSGIAIGGPYLFLGNAKCKQLYKTDTSLTLVPQLFATVSGRIEDLECDDRTFAALGKAAIWTKDAYDNTLNAFELNPGDCSYGGGGPVGFVPSLVQAPAGSVADLDLTIDQSVVYQGDTLQVRVTSGPNVTGAVRVDCAAPSACSPVNRTVQIQGKGGPTAAESTGVGVDTIVAWIDHDGDKVQDGGEKYATAQIDWVRRVNYVGMGDSYSAGEGVNPYDAGTDIDDAVGHNVCHRSAGAYARLTHAPHLQRTIKEYAAEGTSGSSLSFIACSGAIVDNLDLDPRFTEPTTQYGNANVNGATDLVTLSIGGNDAGFGAILEKCALEPNCQDASSIGSLTLRQFVDAKMAYLTNRLPAVYSDLRNNRAPGATVVVMGYPRVFPASTAEQDCFSLEGAWIPKYDGFQNVEQTYLNEVADRLSSTIANAAHTAGVYYVDVRGTFAGHEVCGNGGEWISGATAPDQNDLQDHGFGRHYVGSGSFHPNPTGQAMYAQALESFLVSVTTPQNVAPTGLPANPAPMMGGLSAQAAPAAAVPASEPWISSLNTTHETGDWRSACLRKELGVAGRNVVVHGVGYAAGASVALTAHEIGGPNINLGSAVASAGGQLHATVTLPAGITNDSYIEIEAVGSRAREGTLVGLAIVGIALPCPDTIQPAVSITRPTGTYGVGQTVTAAYTCTDAESGIATCTGTVADGAAVNTATVGSKSFSVTATDAQGNTKTGSSPYTVAWSAPVVAGVAPFSGPSTGGTAITITGHNFAPGSTVKVGIAAATNVTVVSPTSITATTPAGSGTQAVTVTSTYGTSNADRTFAYQSSGTYSLWYRGTVNSKGKVVDSSGTANVGTIKTSFGGTVKQTTDSTYGDYLRWPLTECLVAPTNSSCPEAAINPSVLTSVNPAPASGNFEFGASVRIASGITGQGGMNIFQRGNFAAGASQWKLQVEWKTSKNYRVASCRFSDGTNAVLVQGTKAIVPGTWYEMSCNRTNTTFTLTVNEKGGATGDEVVSMSSYLGGIAPTLTPSIGAKEILTAKGKTDLTIDQFHGDMDDIYFKKF